MFADGLRDSTKEIEAVKQGLLATGNVTVKDLWPEWFEEPVEYVEAGTPDAERALAQGAAEDFSGVRWKLPSEGGIGEYEALMRELADNHVTVLDGPGDDGGGWL